MTVMLSSQGIGLITVIAVSGCSVMLLVFRRQKLLELRKNPKQDQEGGLGSLSRDSLNTFSVIKHGVSSTKQGASISWRINFDISESHDCCIKTPNSASTKVLMPSQDKKRNLVKKVRFSEDVVEPSGNNAEYRRRHALASRSGLRHNVDVDSTMVDPERKYHECTMPPNRMALYTAIFHDRSHRALLH